MVGFIIVGKFWFRDAQLKTSATVRLPDKLYHFRQINSLPAHFIERSPTMEETISGKRDHNRG